MATSNTLLDTAPLALLDLEVPGSTGPTPDSELGINRAAALDNFPRNGLQILIPAWSAMGPGDSAQVLLGGDVVVSDTIDQSEVNQRLTLFIAPARFTNGPKTLSYKVTRFGQPAEPSAELAVYVKLTLPGGEDMDEETPGHSELKLEIDAEYVENGVDKDQAAAGVPVTVKAYPNMAEHDEIRLSWGGQFVSHTVLKAEVDTDIEIVVDEATILAAGDSGTEGLAVTFEVYDLVDNRSEDWSAEIRLVVDTGNTRLLAPIIKEANNNVLNLDALGDSPITAQIVAMDSNFAVDDQIEVKLRGTAADGTPVRFTCPPKLITSVPSIPEILVPNAQVRLLAQAQAIFSYRLIKKNGTPDLLSKGRFVSVIGEIKRLLAPIAKDALQGALDPTLTRTTVEIPWDDTMQEGQVIDLKWLGTRPDLSIYFPELTPHPITHGDAVAKLPIPMVVSGIHLAAINGGTLELYYQLQSDVVTRMLVNRESLHTALLTVGEPRAELPAPTVDGELDGVLDPENVPSGTTLIVPKYNGIAPGDEVHCEWVGSETGKYEDFVKLNTSTATRPVPFTIRYELVAGNLGGTVDASYFVNRIGGRVSASEVLPMQIGEGGIPLPAPTIDHVDSDGVLDPDTHPTTSVRVSGAGANLKVGDTVTTYWVGVPGPGTSNQEFRVGVDNQNLVWPIANSLIEPSRNTTVQVRYGVARVGGAGDNSQIQPVQIKAAAPVGGENFEAHDVGRLPLNQPIPFASGLVITVIATANETAIIDPASGLPQFGLKALFCAGRHKLKIAFDREITQFDLSHAITATANGELKFFGGNGAIVQTEHLRQAPPDQVINENFSLTAPCAYVEFTVDFFGSIIDNLAWR